MKANWPAIVFVAADFALFLLSAWGWSAAPWEWLRVVLGICAISFGGFFVVWLICWSQSVASGRY